MCFSWKNKPLPTKKRKRSIYINACDRILETKGWKIPSGLLNLLLINTQWSKENIKEKKNISCLLGMWSIETSMIPTWEISRDRYQGGENLFLSSNTLEIKINRQSVSKKQMLCWKALQAELHQLAFSGEAGLQRLTE